MQIDLFDLLVASMNDKLNPDESLALWQRLIDSGVAWMIDGTTGRMADDMLASGLCHAPVMDRQAIADRLAWV